MTARRPRPRSAARAMRVPHLEPRSGVAGVPRVVPEIDILWPVAPTQRSRPGRPRHLRRLAAAVVAAGLVVGAAAVALASDTTSLARLLALP